MRLVQVSLENFMGYSEEHVIGLDRLGLVLLSGQNLDDPSNDSNGSGKSTLLEAITWCNFGEGLPRRQGNAEKGVSCDEVCSEAVGQQTRVTVIYQDEQTEEMITVRRWRKYKAGQGKRTSGASLKIGDIEEQFLDTDECDRRICEILGITRDIWCRSIIFGQESQFNFCESTSKERADILTTVMGLEAVDGWLKRIRDVRLSESKELSRLEGALEAQLKMQQSILADDPTEKVQAWEADRLRRSAEARQRLADIEREGHQKKEALADEPVAQRIYDAAVFEEQQAQQAFTGIQPVVPPDDQAVRLAQQGLMELQKKEAVISASLAQLQALEGASHCPTCFQPVQPQIQRQLWEGCQQQLRALEGQLGHAQGMFQQAQGQWQDQLARFNQEFNESRGQALQRFQQASQQRKTAEEMQHRYLQLRQELVLSRSEWQREHQALRAIEGETNPFSSLASQRQEQLDRCAQEISRLERSRDDQIALICLLDWWDSEIPRFKTWLFDAVVDHFAMEANRWLQIVSGGVIWVQITTSKQLKSGDVKDDLDVQVCRWNPDGTITTRPYRLWSGGEKRRIALAVDLGLSRLMATRASKGYRFVALDEIDRHLDQQGREGLRAVLEALKEERETCLVVTHDPDFKVSFDRRMQVTKQGGCSFISQVSYEDEQKNQKKKEIEAPIVEEPKPKAKVVSNRKAVGPAGAKDPRGRKRTRDRPGHDTAVK